MAIKMNFTVYFTLLLLVCSYLYCVVAEGFFVHICFGLHNGTLVCRTNPETVCVPLQAITEAIYTTKSGMYM